MFGDVEKMANGMFKDMMQTAQEKTAKMKMGAVNFVIEKPLKDGKVIKANSYNPILLVKSFFEFEKMIKSYPSRSSSRKDKTDNSYKKSGREK